MWTVNVGLVLAAMWVGGALGGQVLRSCVPWRAMAAPLGALALTSGLAQAAAHGLKVPQSVLVGELAGPHALALGVLAAVFVLASGWWASAAVRRAAHG
jgi:hypothetical protein